jgi:Rha family phage regulatory protein
MSETKSNSKKPKMPEIKLVEVHGKKLITTSLIVSKEFNKRHDDVLKKIDTGFKSENIEILNFSRRNFAESSYTNSQNKTQKMYEMTEEGFADLAMSFTGEKSRVIRIRFLGEFKRMYNHINDPSRKEALQYKRDTARPMTDMLTFVRETLGKTTKGNPHCSNEHLFCNRALTGIWDEINEDDLDAYDGRLLGLIRQHNTMLMTRHLKQADRRKLLDDFVAQYRAKNPKQDLIEEPKAPYTVRRLEVGQ